LQATRGWRAGESNGVLSEPFRGAPDSATRADTQSGGKVRGGGEESGERRRLSGERLRRALAESTDGER
jgi:hypothetical protein